MSRSITQINVANDTWQHVFDTLNQIANTFANTVTVSSNSVGDATTGNGFITGIFGSNTLVATNIRGGTVATPAHLNVSSNAVFSGAQVNVSSNVSIVALSTVISTNSSIAVLTITGNSSATNATFSGTQLNVIANAAFTGSELKIPVGNTSARPPAANGLIRYNSETSSYEGYANNAWYPFATAVGGVINADTLNDQGGDYYLDSNNQVFVATGNIAATTVKGALIELDQEKVSRAGDSMSGALTLDLNSGSLPAADGGTVLHLGQSDSANSILMFDAFGAKAGLVARRSGGTSASKTAVANDDVLLTVAAVGYDGDTYYSNGSVMVDLRAAQAWSNTAHGTKIVLRTTALNSTTLADLAVFQSANVVISAPTYITGNLAVTGAGSYSGNLAVTGSVTANNLGTVSSYNAANASDYWANVSNRALTTTGIWAAANAVSLVDQATVSVPLNQGINFKLTIGGNRTLGQPSGAKIGQSGFIRITQDGSGGRTLDYHDDWKFSGGTAPVLSTAAGAVDLLHYVVVDANFVYASLVKGVS